MSRHSSALTPWTSSAPEPPRAGPQASSSGDGMSSCFSQQDHIEHGPKHSIAEIIDKLEEYDRQESISLPICLLAFLQDGDSYVKASILYPKHTSKDIIENDLRLLERDQVTQRDGTMDTSDAERDILIRIPDRHLKERIIEWSFESEIHPKASLANDAFSRAVDIVREANLTQGIDRGLPTYQTLLHLEGVFLRLAKSAVAHEANVVDPPRFIRPTVIGCFGNLLLSKADGFFKGRDLVGSMLAKDLLQYVQHGLIENMELPGMWALSQSASRKAKIALQEHEIIYPEAAESLTGWRIKLGRSIATFRVGWQRGGWLDI